MSTTQRIATIEILPEGYELLRSEFGGVFFQIGDFASEDHDSESSAAVAARRHARDALLEALPITHEVVRSEFGGYFFQVGDFASEDYATETEAARAAELHVRETEHLPDCP